MKMMAIAPTLDIYLPYPIRFLYIVWCGAIVLSMLEVMRRPECRIKQYSSHTIFLLAPFWEQRAQKIEICNIMGLKVTLIAYLSLSLSTKQGLKG